MRCAALTPAENLIGVDRAVQQLSEKIDLIASNTQDPVRAQAARRRDRRDARHRLPCGLERRAGEAVRGGARPRATRSIRPPVTGGGGVLSALEDRIAMLADALEARNRSGQNVPTSSKPWSRDWPTRSSGSSSRAATRRRSAISRTGSPNWSRSSMPPMPGSTISKRSSAGWRSCSSISSISARRASRAPWLAAAGGGRALARHRRPQADGKEHPGHARSRPRHARACRRPAGHDRDRHPRQARPADGRRTPTNAGFAPTRSAPAEQPMRRPHPQPAAAKAPVSEPPPKPAVPATLPPAPVLQPEAPQPIEFAAPPVPNVRTACRGRAPPDRPEPAARSSAGARRGARTQSRLAGGPHRRLRSGARRSQAAGHSGPGRQIEFHRRGAPRRAGGGSRRPREERCRCAERNCHRRRQAREPRRQAARADRRDHRHCARPRHGADRKDATRDFRAGGGDLPERAEPSRRRARGTAGLRCRGSGASQRQRPISAVPIQQPPQPPQPPPPAGRQSAMFPAIDGTTIAAAMPSIIIPADSARQPTAAPKHREPCLPRRRRVPLLSPPRRQPHPLRSPRRHLFRPRRRQPRRLRPRPRTSCPRHSAAHCAPPRPRAIRPPSTKSRCAMPKAAACRRI